MSKEIESYIRAGYPAIILTTAEEDRALRILKDIANEPDIRKEFAYWSITKGIQTVLKDFDSMNEREISSEIHRELSTNSTNSDPLKALEEGISCKSNRGKIFVLLDFHPFCKAPNVWRRAKDLFKLAKQCGVTYVFVSSKFEVPEELKREVITTSLPLPTRAELLNVLQKIAGAFGTRAPTNPEPYVEAALGLTINEAENAYATSLAKNRRFDVMLINHVKEKTICSGGILDCKTSKETLNSIGGLKNFTNWAQKRFLAFSPEAKEYGIPAPKGTLLIGVPGSGKSLSAKALANLWQKPLLKLDIGKLFGSLVGETESNTRKALEIAEAMAPCILWIDEIEKGLAGLESSGKTDSGVTSRAFGTILTWLQEKEAPVFVIATANNVSKLPPEFLRKGRFDEIFFVDIPSKEERKEIFEIQLRKYKRNPEKFDCERFAGLSENFTGAEIEQVIVNSLYDTWASDNRVLTDDAICMAISNITPIAGGGSMSTQIMNIRKWAKEAHIQKANATENDVNCISGTGRVIIPEEDGGEA